LLVAHRRIPKFGIVLTGWLMAAVFIAAITRPLIHLARTETAQLPFGPLKFWEVLNSVFLGQYFIGAAPAFHRDVPVPPTNLWSLAAIVAACVGWVFILGPIAWRRLRPTLPAGGSVGVVLLAAPWIFLPLAIILAYSVNSTPIYTARYFAFTTPAVALLIGAAVSAVFQRRAQLLAAIGIFALIVSPIYLSQRTPTSKNGSDWQWAASIVQARATPGEAIYYGMVDVDSERHEGEIRYGYPAVLSTLHNVSMHHTGVQKATLWGTYYSLPHSIEKIQAAPLLWAVLGHDGQPSPRVSSSEEFIEAQGLHLDRIWRGKTTDVLLFSR
jgi:mannosyltransferase